MAAVAEVVMGERDRRAMNHMDPDTKLVHARLEEWARWAKEIGIAGYPKQSPTEKAALYGALGLPQEPLNKPEPLMPDHVAVIDAAICKLGEIDRAVVKTYYLNWTAVEVMARKHKMRVLQFQRVLRRARWRVMGYLDAIGG
jgi:hypothetical protein